MQGKSFVDLLRKFVMWVAVLAFLICFGFAIRSFLIVTGWYKAPVLRTFEIYGEEIVYSPLMRFILWIILGAWIGFTVALNTGFMYVVGFVLFILTPVWSEYVPRLIRRYPGIFLVFPRWYYDLYDRTSREERRQIAYRWLYLPYSLRLRYNSDARAFEHWMEMVIISSG